ncbi:MAG: Uma2 family endonuclease [Planctomycetes bacterium]|nr:Uma2 family endonuclease [Planctomycetota bacterium]
MKVLYLDAPEEIIRERRRKGLDRYDELWEGVYHMVSPPSERHQYIVGELFGLLGVYAQSHKLGTLRLGLGVRAGEENYRIPEWIFLRTGRETLLKPDSGTVDEGPDAVLEVRSPGDETDEKIPFYEKRAVRELIIVDRDTRAVAVFCHTAGHFRPVSPNAAGWIYSEALRAFFRTDVAGPRLLLLLEFDRSEHSV